MEELVQSIGMPVIAVLVPLIVAAFKKYVWERVPKAFLPVVAPVIGAVLEFGSTYITGLDFTGVSGAAAGLAGVGLREIKDQVEKAMST